MAMSLLVSGSLVLATGGLFHVLENKRPLEEINRTKHLKFDIVVVVLSALMVAGLTVWLLDGFVRTWLTNNVQLFDSIVLKLRHQKMIESYLHMTVQSTNVYCINKFLMKNLLKQNCM